MDDREAPRRRRGRPSSITRGQIVDAVLGLAGDRRLEDVSMREIARELGVPVMTLYHHVANKHELSVAVVDHILGPVRVPDASEGTWRERIRMLERDARQAMARNRAGGLLRSGGSSGEAMRLADGVLSILLEGGFSPPEARQAFGVLYTYMLGQIELDSFFDSPWGDGEPTLERITSGLGADRDELFEFGFDAVVTGIETLLRPANPGEPQ